jgi:hypothetical protein
VGNSGPPPVAPDDAEPAALQEAAAVAEVDLVHWPHPVPAPGTLVTVSQGGESREFRVLSAGAEPPYALHMDLEQVT